MFREASTIVIDATYSGRGHHAMAGYWESVQFFLGIPAAILSAIGGAVAAVNALAGSNQVITAIAALLAGILGSLKTALRPEEAVDAHASKGDRYHSLKADARFFRDVQIPSERTVAELEGLLLLLERRRNALNESPPRRIWRIAYEKATRGIAAGESEYTNDSLWVEPRF